MATKTTPDHDLISIVAAIAFAQRYERHAILRDDGTESLHAFECTWYSAYFLILSKLFESLPLLTITPQRVVPRVLHSDSRQKYVVDKIIPDFVVSAQQYKTYPQEKTGMQIESTLSEAVMVVEIKPTPNKQDDLGLVKKLAWNQAYRQAKYVFADCMKMRTQEKNELCVMVCIGIEWSYRILEGPAAGELTIDTDRSYAEFCNSVPSNSSFLVDSNRNPGASADSSASAELFDDSFNFFAEVEEALCEERRRPAALKCIAANADIFLREEMSDSAIINGLEIERQMTESAWVDSSNFDGVTNAEGGTEGGTEGENYGGIGEGTGSPARAAAESTAANNVELPDFNKLGTQESQTKLKKMHAGLQMLAGFDTDGWNICFDPTETHREIMSLLTGPNKMYFDFSGDL